MEGKLISIVIPMHNEEGNVKLVYEETKAVCEEIKREKGYDYEIVFVNDGSTDHTLELLKEIKAKDPKVRLLSMDRNRGEAAGLTAGFQLARGRYIFTMDGDGQNDPRYFRELLEKLEEGFLVATGYRVKRKEPLFTRKIPSFIANRIIALVTGLKVRDNGCSLKGYRADIPRRYQIPHGFHRFLPALFGVKNSEVVEIPVLDRKRHWGRSHYGLKRTFEVLRELITFPFLKRAPFYEKFFKIWAFLHLIGATPLLFYLLLAPSLWGLFLEGALLLGAGVSYLIYKNLKRFNVAQREGVFKVEEL
uniref:Glycosyltransferase n=1 Tax=Caldimicrobium thiodismutans TaxID=1653476 RepID=A0A832LV65_9BACT